MIFDVVEIVEEVVGVFVVDIEGVGDVEVVFGEGVGGDGDEVVDVVDVVEIGE